MYLCRGFIRKQCHYRAAGCIAISLPCGALWHFFGRHTRARLSYHSPQLTHRQSWLPGTKKRGKVTRPAQWFTELSRLAALSAHTGVETQWQKCTKREKSLWRARARVQNGGGVCPGAACSADLSPPLCSDQRLFVKINFISREVPRGFWWVGWEGVDFASGANKFWALAFLRTACHSKLPRRERRRLAGAECVWKWAVGVHQFWNQLRRDGAARLSDFSH